VKHQHFALFAVALALPLLPACKSPPNSAPAASSAVASATPAPVTSVAAKPWFSGAFSGAYEAKLAPVEVQTGAIREWKADDGKAASGPGKLDLHIDDNGVVDGSSEGSLGASTASGKVEDDALRVTLTPKDATGLHGVLVATREGEGFRGSIQASGSDSVKVRSATVELKKTN